MPEYPSYDNGLPAYIRRVLSAFPAVEWLSLERDTSFGDVVFMARGRCGVIRVEVMYLPGAGPSEPPWSLALTGPENRVEAAGLDPITIRDDAAAQLGALLGALCPDPASGSAAGTASEAA